MEKPEKHGHAPAGGFWKPPEGAATVSPRPAGVLSRNIAFRHRILLFVMPFFSLYSRQSFRCDGEAKFNKNLNASAPVIGPGTNDHHTKCWNLTWEERDIRKALAAGKDYRIFLYCYCFENIQPITPKLDLAPSVVCWHL